MDQYHDLHIATDCFALRSNVRKWTENTRRLTTLVKVCQGFQAICRILSVGA
jgi:hypothetical protein